MDKIQQAIIYNARVNEKEHKDLDKKIKGVSDNINQVKTELETKLENIELTPGEKGEPGKDGIDGKDGLNGKDGKDGKDGVDGKNGLDGKDGRDGVDGIDGINGKDGSPDPGEQIVKKINSQNDKIDYSKIKNLPPPQVEIREIRTGGIPGLETIKQNGTTISNSTKSLNFIGATVTKDSDNVSVTIDETDLTPIDLLNQFNTAYPTCYSEIDYTDELPTTITYYEDSTKALTLYTKTITYTSGLPTTVTIVDNVNSKTLTITNTYTDGILTSVTKAIS